MTFSSRPIFAGAVFGVVMAAGAAFATEADNGSRLEKFGQNIQSIGQNIGRRLDVTQLFNHRDPEEDAPGREASASSVRIDRLENQVRMLNGLVEELQHEVRRLEDQLRRAHADTGGAPPPAAARTATAEPAPPTPGPQTLSPVGPRRGDAFDPSQSPGAPGAPRPIGTTPPSAPLPAATTGGSAPSGPISGGPISDLRSPGAPLDLTHGRLGDAPPAPGPATAANVATPAATPPQTPKDEFDLAVSKLRQGEYEAAEKGFAGFLAKNPKSRLAAQAIYDLGESYFLRERYREAAEKYLEITAKHASSPQGPEAMLRLGQSLNAIGAKEQACASFGEIAVKYPGAPARVRETAQQESKKVRC